MATPFDSIGGLLGLDPETMKKLAAALGASDADRSSANRDAIMQAGFSLMGTRKGQEWGAVGNAGQNALAARQASLQGAQQAKMQQMQMMEHFGKLQQQQNAQKAGQQLNDQLANFNPQAGMASRSGSAADAAQIPNHWETLMQKADLAANAGDEKRAEAFRKAAEFYRPKFSQSPQVGTDPQGAYQFVLDEQGNEKRLGAGVKPDFAEVNTGGDVRFVNRNTMPSAGQSFAKTVSPDSQLSSDTSRRGQNMTDARSRDLNAITQSNAQQASWVNDLERGIQIDPRSGQSRPITAGGAPIGAKGESKKAESAASAQSIIDLARPLIEAATGSYAGSALDKGAQVFGASTDGADAIAQLQVLQARLMTEQPRMEGPQSDRDVELYRQAAGKIGDPTVPRSQKLAAVQTIEALNKRYKKRGSSGATGGWSITPVGN